MKVEMPKIDASRFEDQTEAETVGRILGRGGHLRASKPKLDGTKEAGRAAYVWRMVAFYVSSNPRHQCMPVCADFDLRESDWNTRRALCKELDVLVDKITNTIPTEQWAGVRRWGQALGRIGTPSLDSTGAVVYR